MKTKLQYLFTALAWLALSTLNFQLATAHAQGTAFTYQGRLNDGASPAIGSYDLTFSLFNANTGGSQVGSTLTNTAVGVTNGLFVATADFGAVFNSTPYWLELGVRTNGGSTFTPLSPRQALTPVPYALYAPSAGNAATAGTASAVAPGSVSGASILTGSIMASNLNLASVSSGLTSSFWGLSGNGGNGGSSFLGTIDNQPLDLRAGNSRGLRLQYASATVFGEIGSHSGVDVIGGYAGNYIPSSVVGGTIAGGGGSYRGGILSGNTDYTNSVTGSFGTVGGGYSNTAGNSGTVPGGYGNTATGTGSFAAGANASVTNAHSFVWSDGSQPFSSSGVNRFDVLATGGVFFHANVGIGTASPTETLEINGTSRIDDNDVYLRTGSDRNHGLGYRSIFINGIFITGVDGPFLYGYGGGALGTSDPESIALRWDRPGNVVVSHNLSTATLTIRGGADVAEPFPVTGSQVEPGTVMVIDEANPGQLRRSTQAYDTRVAGIISGANGINPGIQMQQQGLLEGGKNVALTGRVYVQADTSNGAIKPGDLLTTSSTPGRAMKVSDHVRAQGAILGKAMTGLIAGKGMVLVLVTLQ